MEDLRPDALETVAARVVAWHNRHPLARPITIEQVQSVGYVALPYLPPPEAAEAEPAPRAAAHPPEAPAGGSLRERAQARAQQAGGADAGKADKPDKARDKTRSRLKAAFTEDFIAPLSPRRVARWAARHGVAAAQAPRGAPLRQVDPDAAFAGKTRDLLTLYVLTAAVESRGQRVRMLLSPGADEAVLGNHLWSPPRLAGGAVATLGGLTALGLALALWWQSPPPASTPAQAGATTPTATSPVEAPAVAASVPSIRPTSMRSAALADAGLSDTPGPPATAASQATSKTASHAAPKPTAQPPLDVEPTLGRIQLPALGLPHGDGAHNAVRERRLAGQAAPASAPQPAPGATAAAGPVQAAAPPPAGTPPVAPAATQPAAPAAPAAPGKPPAQAAPPAAAVFALSSRRLRTRAESEQTMAAMKSLLAGSGLTAVQVEVVPAEDDWRVVGWPFAQRAQAEKARTLLASRGIRLEVVDF